MFPAMRFAVPAVLVALLSAACGGPGIPAHSGYKQAKAQPWKKAKVIALDEKLEGKADGELDYREYDEKDCRIVSALLKSRWHVWNGAIITEYEGGKALSDLISSSSAFDD